MIESLMIKPPYPDAIRSTFCPGIDLDNPPVKDGELFLLEDARSGDLCGNGKYVRNHFPSFTNIRDEAACMDKGEFLRDYRKKFQGCKVFHVIREIDLSSLTNGEIMFHIIESRGKTKISASDVGDYNNLLASEVRRGAAECLYEYLVFADAYLDNSRYVTMDDALTIRGAISRASERWKLTNSPATDPVSNSTANLVNRKLSS